MKQLLLVDVSNYLYRAFHTVGHFQTTAGVHSGAIYGTINMFASLRRQYPEAYFVCVMDAKGKTFRHQLSQSYKANRPPMDANLASQIPPLRDFIDALGIPIFSISEVEADDVIATLTIWASREEGANVIIASTDKDLMQLVDNQVCVYDGINDRLYDSIEVEKKYKVTPAQILDYLVLVGDSSDNIKGVSKVGAKTAVKWLQQYGSLNEIALIADKIEGVVGENMRLALADGTLDLAKKLVSLKKDVEWSQSWESLMPRTTDHHRWQELCDQFEFKRFHTLPSEWAHTKKAEGRVVVINDLDTLKEWLRKIEEKKHVAVDTETRGEPVMCAEMVGLSLALMGNEGAYIPLLHQDQTQTQLSTQSVIELIKPILENPSIRKIFHNGKYDWHIFANHGITVQGVLEDTKIVSYVQNSGAESTLWALANQHLGLETTSFKEVTKGYADFSKVPITEAAAYATKDAYITYSLHERLSANFSPIQEKVYTQLDRPLMPILAKIERAGVSIDSHALNTFAADMRSRMEVLEQQAHHLASQTFNLNSPKQLEVILFDEMQAPVIRKTSSGKRSTDEGVLEKLALDFPLAKLLLEHRTLAKLVGTYAGKLPQLILPSTNRIHTTLNQTAVITGRLSSSAPNLQNIPIRTEAGRLIRKAFVAGPNQCIISADYSQIELRLAAHIAKDEALQTAFNKGWDIHCQTASEIFGIPRSEVSNEQRRAAKAINFGLIYGMSAFGLARSLAMSVENAQVYMTRYFSRYPQLAEFMQRTRKTAQQHTYVETIFGRMIPLQNLRGGQGAIERFAINAPIQGSAADIMKRAMIKTDAWLVKNKLNSKIILQVHDELLIEADLNERDLICEQLPTLMSECEITVPLLVNVCYGENWDEAH